MRPCQILPWRDGTVVFFARKRKENPVAPAAPAAWRTELKIAALLFVAGAAAAMVYNATCGWTPKYWQNTTFMQALMWVCGHGFENPMVSDVPGLGPFLDSRTDCFDCAQIPEDVRVLPRDTSGMSFEEIDAYHPQKQFPGFLAWQRYHLYLVLSVLALWKVFGVCWSAVGALCGLLYGISTVAGYGLFRLCMRRWLALVFALLLMVSPIHLEMVPQVRDYSKAAFLLTALFLMGCMIRYTLRAPALLLLSALCGAVIGLGLGFRTDVAIAAPAFIVVALAFLPGGLKKTAPRRLLAVLLFCAALAGAGWPIWAALSNETGHFAHVSLLGFLRTCDARLGVGSGWYHLGDPYTDFYTGNLVQSYAHRMHGAMPPTHLLMPAYHEATNLYLKEYAARFPADIVMRAYASVVGVLDEMHPKAGRPWPAGITNQFLQRLYEVRAAVVDHLPGGGRYYAAAGLLVIAAYNLRWAFATLFLLLYFGGYPGTQFFPRHYFYLEFLSLWFTGLLLQQGLLALCWPFRKKIDPAGSTDPAGATDPADAPAPPPMPMSFRRRAAGMAGFALIAAGGVGSLLFGARFYQHFTVGELAGAVAAAQLETLDARVVSAPMAGGAPNILLPGFADHANPPAAQAGLPTQYEYLVVEVAPGPEAVPITFVYEAENTEHFDYTRTLRAPASSAQGNTRIYFPLYYHQDARFKGLHVPAEHLARIAAVHRMAPADAKAIPIWPTLTLPPNWESLPRYQSPTRW